MAKQQSNFFEKESKRESDSPLARECRGWQERERESAGPAGAPSLVWQQRAREEENDEMTTPSIQHIAGVVAVAASSATVFLCLSPNFAPPQLLEIGILFVEVLMAC